MDLLTVSPREAKRDERLKNSGKLVSFTFNGETFPLIPKTIFYDYIYINALLEQEELAKVALEYDAFTDIEFNPEKSINCQAKAAATFVALSRMGLLEKVKDFSSFLSLYHVEVSASKIIKTPVEEPKVEKKRTVKIGSTLIHKAFGEGIIKEVKDNTLKVMVSSVGEKTLGLEWCFLNCEIKE